MIKKMIKKIIKKIIMWGGKVLKEISQPIPDGGVAANSRRATLNFRLFFSS